MLPCPTCGVPTDNSPANAQRPFCSERCRHLDLAKWLDEDYRIPGPAADVDDDAPPRHVEQEDGD